jgi:hypothetical protein
MRYEVLGHIGEGADYDALRVRVATVDGSGERHRLIETDVRWERWYVRVHYRLEDYRPPRSPRLLPGTFEVIRVLPADPLEAEHLSVSGILEVREIL